MNKGKKSHNHKFEIIEKEYDGLGDITYYHLFCECGKIKIVDVLKLELKRKGKKLNKI